MEREIELRNTGSDKSQYEKEQTEPAVCSALDKDMLSHERIKDFLRTAGYREGDVLHMAHKGTAAGTYTPFSIRFNDVTDYNFRDNLNHYYCVSTHDGSKSFGKGSAEEAVCIVIDLDCGQHHNRSQYGTIEEGEKALKRLPEPTAVIYSGGGIQAVYRLKRRVDAKLDLRRYENITGRMVKAAGADTCGTISHTFRLPCTYNIKEGVERRKSLINRMNPGISYTLEELEELTDGLTPEPDVKKVVNKKLFSVERACISKKQNPYKRDLSEEAFNIIRRMINEGREERSIIAVLKKHKCYKHYRAKGKKHTDECLKDIRRITKKLAEERLPKPKNEKVMFKISGLPEPEDGVLSMKDRFDSNVFSTKDTQIGDALKNISHLVSTGESYILSFPCASGKSQASMIYAASKASPEYRIMYVVEKVETVASVADILKNRLGANAVPWHGHNEKLCHIPRNEFIRKKASVTCGKCENPCSAQLKNTSGIKSDYPSADILVTTRMQWTGLTGSGGIPPSFKLVIVDEAPELMEFFKLDSSVYGALMRVFRDHKELASVFDADVTYITEQLKDGGSHKITGFNSVLNYEDKIYSYLKASAKDENNSGDDYDTVYSFLSFFKDRRADIYAFSDIMSSGKPVLHFIRGTVRLFTDTQHIVLDGSAELSDVEWVDFKIAESDAFERRYPNTSIDIVNANPSLRKLNDPKVFNEFRQKSMKAVQEQNASEVLLFKNKNTGSDTLSANLDGIEGDIKSTVNNTVVLNRGEHIGSNRARNADCCLMGMSILRPLPYYVLRASLRTESEITPGRIWNSVSQSPKMRRHGGFSDRDTQDTYLRTCVSDIYQALMRGILRQDASASYRAVILLSGVDVICRLRMMMPGAFINHEACFIADMLDRGVSASGIADTISDEISMNQKYVRIRSVKKLMDTA